MAQSETTYAFDIHKY